MAGYAKEGSVNLLARLEPEDYDTNTIIEISDNDYVNPMIIQSSEEEALSNLADQGQHISSFWMILAIVTNCVQGQFFSLSLPAAQTGTILTLIATLFIGIVFTYTASLAVKYLRPNDSTLADEIMVEIWPKIRWPLTILTRSTSFLLYFCYLVQAYIYVYDGVATWAFRQPADNIDTTAPWVAVISFVCMFGISFITNVRISVLLCSWTAWIPLLSLTITCYVVGTTSTHENVKCWVDSWTHVKGGQFAQSTASGVTALLSFCGVLESCYFEHYSLGTQLAEAKNPKHNVRNVNIAFTINICCYLFYNLFSTIPYGCYVNGDINAPQPPSDYSVLFGQSTFGTICGVIYVLGTIVGAPYTFLICRMSSIDLIPWKKYPQIKKYRRWTVYFFHLILCILAIICNYFELSIQMINEIGAAFSSLLFAALVPVILDTYMCHVNRRPYAWRLCLGIPIIILVGFLSVLQFVQF